MRIHLLDPGYIHPMGHHVEWDLRIAEELVKRGHGVHLFCNIQTTVEAGKAFEKYGSVNPVFQHDPYAIPGDEVHELSLFIDVAMVTEYILCKLPPADLWLWPTMYASDLLACALANPRIPISALLHLEPASKLPRGEVWWEYAFKKANRVDLDLNLCATTLELQQIYSKFKPKYPIKCAPIPQDGLLASEPKRQMQKIGIFGQQRGEKGAHLILTLIDKLLEEGFEVVFQDSSGSVKIGEMPNLTKLGFVENFAEEISKCDFVLLPYNPEDYRVRLSGVAAEALASGVPIAAPAGTPSERLVRETGAGTLFSEYTLESILNAVHDAKVRYAELAEAAFRTSQTWASKHGYSNFVSNFLEGVHK